MDFALSDEQEMFRDAVRGALARAGGLRLARDAAQGPAAVGALMREQGWAGIGIPEPSGGQGGGMVELTTLSGELGRVAAPWPVPATGLGALLASRASAGAGGRILDGTCVAVPVVRAEVGFGAVTCVASDGARGMVVTGEVGGVLGAAEAGVLLVPVHASGQVAVVAVERGAAGVDVASAPLTDVTRRLAVVTLDAAPATPLIAGDAGRLLAELACCAQVLVAADAIGAAEQLLEMTLGHVADRRQFGVPIGSFQAVKHTAADMLVDLEIARSAVGFAAWSLDADPAAAAPHAAMAKWLATEASARIADRALALHGAVGFTWEHDLHLLLKRVRADLRLYGGPATHRARVALALDIGAPALASA